MMMIEKVTKIDFVKDHEMTDLKLQFLIAPVISMDVPSTLAAPRSTRSCSATPTPTTSSSSSGGVLRVLKSMFAWCWDTHQCQDVLLSNQRRQNKKMGIDDFNELTLPHPPLNEDPFVSLSVINIAAMEAAPEADDASGSEYEDDVDGENNEDDDE
jgi:hypothetical protein